MWLWNAFIAAALMGLRRSIPSTLIRMHLPFVNEIEDLGIIDLVSDEEDSHSDASDTESADDSVFGIC